MLHEIQTKKLMITEFLDAYLNEKSIELANVNEWMGDFAGRLRRFSSHGKMIRGSIVIMVHDIMSGEYAQAAIAMGAALELIHGGFLIHDDIMDHDQLRRGVETIYYQYEKAGIMNKISDPSDYGRSMGICAGDETFFIAYDLILKTVIPPRIKIKLLKRISHEMIRVGLAQMEDINFGQHNYEPSEEKILNMYRYKTANYTFSLPLYCGLALSDIEADMELVEKIGENLGVIFQIKDDEIGLYSNEDVTGKPVGSDIRNNKKTLHRYFLLSMSSENERSIASKIFGNPSMTLSDIDVIRRLMRTTGAKEKVDSIIQQYAEYVRSSMGMLTDTTKLKPLINSLLEYSLARIY